MCAQRGCSGWATGGTTSSTPWRPRPERYEGAGGTAYARVRVRGPGGCSDSLPDVLLLAIDTSTTAIPVGLHDGSSVVAQATTLDARAHAEHLAPNIRDVLSSAGAEPGDVTDVVVGIGPGPFTGLRVGIVTGRTFAFALGLPVRGLTSLDAIAHE